MSNHQARDTNQKSLAQQPVSNRYLSSMTSSSPRSNEFMGHIPVGDRIFSTLVTEKTSARAGLEKAAAEQGGRVLTYFDERYNAHEIIGVWLPDGFTYCSGDQKKVTAALNQSGIPLDSNIAADLMVESSRSEGRGSMHFYVGKDGIPFTRSEDGQIEFHNADEFRFSRNQSVISWANTNSAFDPQVLSDFGAHYANSGGSNLTQTALKEIELAHGGNRVSDVKLENPILIITVSTGEIAAASEYRTSLDQFEVQRAAEFTAVVASVLPMPVQVLAVTSNATNSYLSAPTIECQERPIITIVPDLSSSRYEVVFRQNNLPPAQNDTVIRVVDSSPLVASSTNAPISDLVRFIQRQPASNDVSPTTSRKPTLAEKIENPASTIGNAPRVCLESPVSAIQPNFRMADVSQPKSLKSERPNVAQSHGKNTLLLLGAKLRAHLVSVALPTIYRRRQMPSDPRSLEPETPYSQDIPKPQMLSTERSKPPKRSSAKEQSPTKSPQVVNRKSNVSNTNNRPISKNPKRQFSSFKTAPESLSKSTKSLDSKPRVRNTRKEIVTSANSTLITAKIKTKKTTSKPGVVIDLATYRAKVSKQTLQVKKPAQVTRKIETTLENQIIKAVVTKKTRSKKKNKKKMPSVLLHQLIGLFQVKRRVNGIGLVGSLG